MVSSSRRSQSRKATYKLNSISNVKRLEYFELAERDSVSDSISTMRHGWCMLTDILSEVVVHDGHGLLGFHYSRPAKG